MSQINICYFKSTIGEFIVGVFEGKLCIFDYRYRKMRDAIDARIKQYLNAEFVEKEDNLHKEIIKQFNDYLEGSRKQFNIPIVLAGTDFQKKVWKILLEIKYGETESYLTLSKRLGDEKAIRAVATANGANAIGIIVPCHRVIGSDGKLVGYAGGLNAKKKLLQLEKEFSVKKEGELF